MNKRLMLTIVLAMLAAACTPAVPVAAPDEPREVAEAVAAATGVLAPFDSCDALLSHIKAEASERVGPYGLDGTGYPPFWGGFLEDIASPAAETTAGDSGRAVSENFATIGADESGAGVYTDTNTQESGVGEPDIVKTDGRRILTLSENILTYVDVTGAEPVAIDSLRFDEGWAHELFFAGDRAFVLTNGGTWGIPMPLVEGDARIAPEYAAQAAALFEIDLSDPSDLKIAATLRLEGTYLSARAVGDTVRMALTAAPSTLGWVYPSTPNGEDRAEEVNRQIIQESTIADWIPDYTLERGGETVEGPIVNCERLYRPADFAGFDVVSVLSFDLTEGLTAGAGAGVLASGQTVYASTDRFYVATSKWVGTEITDQAGMVRFDEDYTTQLHAFDNTGDSAVYVASGEVAGSLLNQFSMDEHEGYLRAITTDGSPWSETDKSETFLTVFEELGDELVEVGKVGGLGKGESLYSARLLDDIGFAVTFRQVDPFYVLDLSDPTNPLVTGELKVPGFSTYLHPIGDDRVLGLGQDATEDGNTTGLKMSLYSVADPANPTELASWKLPNANSPAEYDHRAFQYLPEQGIAVLPVSTWDGGANGAYLLQVGADSITEIGTVTHVVDTGTPESDCTPLTEDDITSQSNELYTMTRDGYSRIQVCEPGATGGFGSYSCNPIPLSELRGWGLTEDEVSALESRFAPDSRVEMCWPDDSGWREQIQRSLVIDATLYTTSIGHLQANDLEGLEVVGKVSITG